MQFVKVGVDVSCVMSVLSSVLARFRLLSVIAQLGIVWFVWMNFFWINCNFDRPQWKGHRVKVPGNETAREQKAQGQGVNRPGSYWPIRSGERWAWERKGSVPCQMVYRQALVLCNAEYSPVVNCGKSSAEFFCGMAGKMRNSLNWTPYLSIHHFKTQLKYTCSVCWMNMNE